MPEEIEGQEVVEETEVDEEGDPVEKEDEPKAAPVNPELAELRGQVKTLTEMLQSRGAPEPKAAPKPKPLFTDEQLEELDDGQKPFARGMNTLTAKIAEMEQKLAGVEDSTADGDFKREVSTFIDSHKELKSPEVRAKFEAFVNEVLFEGKVTPFLQAAFSHLVGKKPAKKKPAMVSGKPKTVAGSIVKSKVEPVSEEQAKREAREEGLAILRRRRR